MPKAFAKIGKIFAAILLSAMTAMAVSSCSKDENKNEDDSGTYTPTVSDNPKQLIEDAETKLRAARQLTIIETEDEGTENYYFNADAKKVLRVDYDNNCLVSPRCSPL